MDNLIEVNKILAKAVFFLLKDENLGIAISDSKGKLFSIFRDKNTISFAEIEDKNIKEGMLLKFGKENKDEG